jgi:hypothetical protein
MVCSRVATYRMSLMLDFLQVTHHWEEREREREFICTYEQQDMFSKIIFKRGFIFIPISFCHSRAFMGRQSEPHAQ